LRNRDPLFPRRSGGLALWLLFSIVSLSAAAAAAPAPGEPTKISEADRQQARTELESGARAYRERDYARAQRHFDRSRDLDPSQPAVRLLVARAIHAQYRVGEDPPGNTAKAREAIAAYREALANDPASEEAYQAVVSLYEAIGEIQRQRDWILRQARDASVSAKKRAEAYTLLAGKEERCARRVAERLTPKGIARENRDSEAASETLQAESGADAAMRRATRGLKFAEKALGLDPENERAWSAKIQLLSTLAKLAGMQGRTGEQARYEKLAGEARSRANDLMERARQKSEVRSY